MTHADIFHEASRAANDATTAQFGATGPYCNPTITNAAGDYWTLVYQATVAALLKHVNGVY